MPSKSFPILKIAIPSPLRQLFDYLPPSDLQLQQCEPGIRMQVRLRQRKTIGILIAVEDHSDVPLDKLKPAIRALDDQSPFPEDLFKLCLWAAEYYHHPLGDVLGNALPTLLRQGEDADLKQHKFWHLTLKGQVTPAEQLAKNAVRQQQAISILQQHPKGLTQSSLTSLGITSATLQALQKKGLVESKQQSHERKQRPVGLAEPPLPLNPQQQQAYDQVIQCTSFTSLLLQGVTGSGKTEVYLQAIYHILQQGKQVLVLVPEIGLTPQTLHRFEQRFTCHVTTFHSGMTDRERLDAWLHCRDEDAKIVIGTRSAIFLPFKQLGLIIVDEEHDQSFKQQEGFRYSARDLAIFRARQWDIPVLLGSATPSMETWYNAKLGRYQLLKLKQRAGGAKPPTLSLIDIRQQKLTDGFSQPALESINNTLKQGEQAMVFINRRGYAPTLLCHDCGWMAQCPSCDSRFTVHKNPPHLHCHHCAKEQPLPTHCRQCGSRDLLGIGMGTEKMEDAIQRQFPKQKVIRIDRDSTSGKNRMQHILEEIQKGEPAILVGTQMIAKGHHFPNVTLVVIVDADSGFFASDFRAPEKMAQLIVQVSGRAGRASKSGSVILQTHHPDHPSLQTLIHQGYEAFVESILPERQLAELPPTSYLALIRAESTHLQKTLEFLINAKQYADQQAINSVQNFGPIPAPMERKAGRYRAQLLLQSKQRKALHQLLGILVNYLSQQPNQSQVRWSVDVDPADLT